MKERSVTLGTLIVLGAALILSGAPTFAADKTLTALKVTVAPALDGKADPVWAQAPATTIPVSGGRTGDVDVIAKAVYTGSDIYFLFQWKDATASFNRQFEFDGKEWKKIKGNEDRLSVAWEIGGVAGFKENGCMISCHGDKKHVAAGEKLDLWHWKGSRSGPVGQMDDQVVDQAKRQGDKKVSGGESDNWDDARKAPKYTWKGTPSDSRYLMKSEAVEIADYSKFKAGDRLPREVLEPFMGSRGDVSARGVWTSGMWTLEVKRALDTKNEDDVRFTDMAKGYAFAVAVHDNDGDENHSFSETFVLKFK